ncbi:MAG TPA: hypothetical protein VF893_03915 [Candidatus Bathyarchaeia archaeon]
MENNTTAVQKPDRIMWFSMWFLGAVATFGLAFFPMFYYSIERRNLHFRNQHELESRIASFHKKEWKSNAISNRNSKLWATSIFLVFPVFVIVYFLSRDLVVHERRQEEFFSTVYPDLKYVPQKISIRNCLLITIVTLGVGVVYWLYRVVNVYNNHFKEQRHIEHEMLRLMEAKTHVESV